MLKTRVKAAAVTNLTDARYFAAWEVAYLGFDCNPASPTYLPLEKSRAIKEWVDGVEFVAEFGRQSPPDMLFHLAELQPDVLQIPASLPVRDFELLNDQVGKLLIEIEVDDVHDWSSALDEPRYRNGEFLLKFTSTDWQTLREKQSVLSGETLRHLCAEYPIYLDLSVAADQVGQLLDATGARGIVVRGGDEEKVGYKSFDDLDELFERLEILV